MEAAFWDSSAIVPLCVLQAPSPRAEELSRRYTMVVWWGTRVEVRAAFARLLRMGLIVTAGNTQAQIALNGLCARWREVNPAEAIRTQAARLVDHFPLKAADAMQLAAALIWCNNHPSGRRFIAGDELLLDAAQQLGFNTIRP